ncbi:MAG: bifunctional oligoribonuclease/PAP phosphatase NrnA [Candidatus Omnitrophica bacterium]|nr:bifunctional oligoribonuclease/PAP phosphatase NrnA [Candidatus Omnitrophota bacterium]
MEVKLSLQNKKKIEDIVEVLKNKKSFLITSHINIDGDGIGSEISLYIALKKIGKKVEIINQDRIPAIFKFLPFSEVIKTVSNEEEAKNFEVGIVIDCGNLDRAGKIKKIIKKLPFIINIDHHLTNSQFGNINWIDPSFSSTGEMIYFVCDKLGNIDKNQAVCLYTSIIYDTYCFTHHLSNYTLDVAKKLINLKINPEKIAQKIFCEKSIQSVILFKLALETLKFNKKKKVCSMKVTKEMFKRAKAKEEHTEGFVEFLISIKGVEVGVLFKEKDKGVKVSMRSKGNIDVESIAQRYNGGGHREAAGCFLENKGIEEVEAIIMKELQWMEF